MMKKKTHQKLFAICMIVLTYGCDKIKAQLHKIIIIISSSSIKEKKILFLAFNN